MILLQCVATHPTVQGDLHLNKSGSLVGLPSGGARYKMCKSIKKQKRPAKPRMKAALLLWGQFSSSTGAEKEVPLLQWDWVAWRPAGSQEDSQSYSPPGDLRIGASIAFFLHFYFYYTNQASLWFLRSLGSSLFKWGYVSK